MTVYSMAAYERVLYSLRWINLPGVLFTTCAMQINPYLLYVTWIYSYACNLINVLVNASIESNHVFYTNLLIFLLSVYVDKTVADRLFEQVKVLCFILTTPSHLSGTVGIVNATWARRCNKVLYVLCPKTNQQDFLSTCKFSESKKHLVAKVHHSFMYAYGNLIHKYDWFLKADDDTYVVMENLRYLLSHHDSNSAGYLGYHFKTHMAQGYMSGGAGYVISRQGLRQLVEEGFNKGACATDGEVEDVEIGKCLEVIAIILYI